MQCPHLPVGLRFVGEASPLLTACRLRQTPPFQALCPLSGLGTDLPVLEGWQGEPRLGHRQP